MPKKQQVPSYRLHKARNCAVVTTNIRNRNVGPFGSPESHSRYAAKIAEWQRAQTFNSPTSLAGGPSFTIGQLAQAYQRVE